MILKKSCNGRTLLQKMTRHDQLERISIAMLVLSPLTVVKWCNRVEVLPSEVIFISTQTPQQLSLILACHQVIHRISLTLISDSWYDLPTVTFFILTSESDSQHQLKMRSWLSDSLDVRTQSHSHSCAQIILHIHILHSCCRARQW